ncbi:MAG: ketoacyl-ACP synthase III [Acidimicrobiia bacterium]|nr:ketoacyl-ACP synthase III [Acidimicrobiia bacterium]
MTGSAITGWGKCLPPTVLTNHDLEMLVDTSDDWITSRTGIKERRISHVGTAELATVAGFRALAAAGLEPPDVDLVSVATCTPDMLLPSAASLVQDRLGAVNAGAVDQNAACSGFLYSLITASGMVQAGIVESALVIGAERLTYFIDFTDRGTAVLYGDGAGAVVVQATDEPGGLKGSRMGSDGSLAKLLWAPGSGTATDRVALESNHKHLAVEMNGPEVFKKAVTAMGDAAAAVVEQAGWALDDVDILIPHQANIRIIDATARRLHLDPAKVFINIASYGNTSAATIPIALTEALEMGRVEPGARIVFAAFGAGLSWAAAAYEFGSRTEPLGVSDAELPPTDGDVMALLAENFAYFGGGPDR